jgi:galactonate dehydratase
MSNLKVTGAEVFVVPAGAQRQPVLRLHTDAGITGVGEAAVGFAIGALGAAGMMEDLVNHLILGQDPFAVEHLWQEMYDHSFWAKGGGSVTFAAISAIETALLDIKGKALGLPVYELMGGKCRDTLRTYCNGWSFTARQPEEFADAARRVIDQGWTALKMYPLANPKTSNDAFTTVRHVSGRHLEREDAELAVARVAAVRRAIGPNIELMLDLSGEVTPGDMIRLARRFAEHDILFLEEPSDAMDPAGIRRVRDNVPMPIAAGERVSTRYGFRQLFELEAIDIAQPDLGNTGGLLESKKIAAMAEAFNVRVAPHVCGGPVLNAASLHLSASLPSVLIHELYPFRHPDHFAYVDRAPEQDVKDGFLPVRHEPGIGIALRDDVVAPHRRAVCGVVSG